MTRKVIVCFIILLILTISISATATINPLSRPAISSPTPGLSSIPEVSVPSQPSGVVSSKPDTIILYSNNSENGEYVDHIVTIENAHKTNPVWLNVIAGPYGTFSHQAPDNVECHPGDCRGDICCPAVSCPEKSCGSNSCTAGSLSLPDNGGFKLDPGKSQDVVVKVLKDKGALTGAGGLTVWARTGCVPTGEAEYPLTCDTANCDMHYGIHSNVQCGGIGSNTPATKAEITFNGWMGIDTYDISLVDGWNVPMTLKPVSKNYVPDPGNHKSCSCAGGNKDLFGPAQTEINKMVKVKSGTGAPLAIYSACSYSQIVEANPNPMYCCIGQYSGSQCGQHLNEWPKEYQTPQFFQKYCPNAYSFAYSDARGGEHSCKPNDGNPINYKLTIYGEDHPSLEKETAVSFYSDSVTPSVVTFADDNIDMDVTPLATGYHTMHLEVHNASISPEDPDDYHTNVANLGHIYHIFSTIPDSDISAAHIRITYPEEDYVKAGLKEGSLRIWSFNQDTDTWEMTSGDVQVIQNIVTGTASELGYFTISGEKEQNPAGIITLYQGWNFISIAEPLLQGYNTAEILSGIDTGGHSMLTFDPAFGWVMMKKDDVLKPLEGYWIYSTKKVDIQLHVDQNPVSVPPAKQLFEGWNAIGFSYTSPASARDTLLSVQDRWVYCIGYNAIVQKYDVPIINDGSEGYSDSRKMNPGQGYWLFMSDEGTLAGLSMSTVTSP